MCDPSQKKTEPVPQERVDGLDDCLKQAQLCLASLGDDYSDSCHALSLLSERLESGQFRLAVLGQFKRGKSTLLNALLGEALLPTDILPVTAIPTYIGYADALSIRVVFSSDEGPKVLESSGEGALEEFLATYVTEKGNPNNQRNVSKVEIGHPSALLEQGVVLIDTPGIGSTYKHNTEVAYQVLPQCDAALFLVSPDPPITEAELSYLTEICQHLPRTFFLLNKVDFLDSEDQLASLKFLSEQLTPLLDGPPQVLPVSARNGLKSRLNDDAAGWKQSGMDQVEKNLIDFFAREKHQTLHASLRKKIADQLNQALMQVQLSLRALTLSEEELKQKIELFRQSLPDIEREKLAGKDVLEGDLKRLETDLTSEVERIRKRAKEEILTEMEALFQTVAETEDLERQTREFMSERIPPFFASEAVRIRDLIEKQGTDQLRIHQQKSDALLEKVRQSAADLFDIPYRAPSATDVYASFSVPGWSSDLFISDMDPLGQKLSRKFLTQKYRHRRTISRLRESGRKLIGQNVEQINWALRRGVDESFRQFGAGLSEQLDKSIVAIRSAMETALRKSESQSFEVAERELSLRKASEELQRLHGWLEE